MIASRTTLRIAGGDLRAGAVTHALQDPDERTCLNIHTFAFRARRLPSLGAVAAYHFAAT